MIQHGTIRIGPGVHGPLYILTTSLSYHRIMQADNRVKDKDAALYNLRKDPHEQVNLYKKPEYAGVIRRLEKPAEKCDRDEI